MEPIPVQPMTAAGAPLFADDPTKTPDERGLPQRKTPEERGPMIPDERGIPEERDFPPKTPEERDFPPKTPEERGLSELAVEREHRVETTGDAADEPTPGGVSVNGHRGTTGQDR